MEVYTPGHGLITDSLILQGICRYLAWHSVYDARIIRKGLVTDLKSISNTI